MMNNIPYLFSILKFTFPDYFRLNVFPTQSKKTELQIENCPFQNYLFFLPPHIQHESIANSDWISLQECEKNSFCHNKRMLVGPDLLN